MREDITVCVCTYNEEKNIKDCIESIKRNGIQHILVIDASKDNTKEIAIQEGAEVITCEKGLARQRQKAIDMCKTKYLSFVDADDRIENDCIQVLVEEMEEMDYAAIQASVRVYQPYTYWQRAIDATWRYCIFKVGPTNMVGRPAIYRTDAIKAVGSDLSFVNIGDEDTAISVRMEQKGYRQGIGRGISYRKCHSSFQENKKEWIKYGKGDAMIILQYPDKKKAIFHHVLINYPIKRSWKLIKNGKIKYCLYPILVGFYRYVTIRKTLGNCKIKKFFSE